ncbi:putative antirepression domain protein [Clostridioides difficile Y270]|nr:putative antirepression domain protein [Clostridioides difficile Y270]
MYLWTERGANRHCKILDTDKAWEQFDNLEESYFNKKKDTLITNQLSPELQLFKQIFDTVAKQEIEQKQIKQDITETKQEIKSIKDVVTLNTTDWREETRKLIVSMAQNLGGNEYINTLRKESYELLCKRFNVDLKRRLNNRRSKMAEKGVCKSRREKFNYLDVIQEQNYLIEGYVIVIKDMAIKYGVFMEKTN